MTKFKDLLTHLPVGTEEHYENIGYVSLSPGQHFSTQASEYGADVYYYYYYYYIIITIIIIALEPFVGPWPLFSVS
jgi:hypothetical protein